MSSAEHRRKRLKTPTTPTPKGTGRSWPETDASKPFPRGLLRGEDGRVWRALGRISPQEFDVAARGGKQGPVRKALDMIGMGWVATNTTAYRIAIGSKFDEARRAHEANGWEPPYPLPESSKVPIEDGVLGSDGECELDLFPGTEEDDEANRWSVRQIRRALDQHGVAVVRCAIDATNAVERYDKGGGKRVKIAETMGNGLAGKDGSYYADTESTNLTFHQNTILGCFLDGPTCMALKEKRKAILLSYGEGAENWAHRDGNGDGLFPYQATLLLSEPGIDFAGGEFYVARRSGDGDGVVRTRVEFKHGGDMVIFQASSDGEYDHGMMAVRKGSAEVCRRVAIGLLQQK